jgi:hypothetical protein
MVVKEKWKAITDEIEHYVQQWNNIKIRQAKTKN